MALKLALEITKTALLLSFFCITISVVYAETMSGSTYKVDGGLTSVAQNSEGSSYTVQSAGDSAGGNSTGSTYSSKTQDRQTTESEEEVYSLVSGGGGGSQGTIYVGFDEEESDQATSSTTQTTDGGDESLGQPAVTENNPGESTAEDTLFIQDTNQAEAENDVSHEDDLPWWSAWTKPSRTENLADEENKDTLVLGVSSTNISDTSKIFGGFSTLWLIFFLGIPAIILVILLLRHIQR